MQNQKTTNRRQGWSSWGIGSKLTATTFVWVALVVTLLVGTISWGVMDTMRKQVQSEMQQGVRILRNFIESNDKELRARTHFMAQRLDVALQGTIALEGEGSDLRLTLNGAALNGDHGRMDRFSEAMGVSATVLMRQGDDFVRVATSLKNELGERASGTTLERTHPAYQAALAGQDYMGLATLFGRQYMTHYRPIRDAQGQTIGLAFVGQDFSQLLDNLRAAIRTLKVGKDGYFYVLNATPGPDKGQLIVHPALEGQNIGDSTDSDGRPFIRELMEQKQGYMTYPWLNPGESTPREKAAAFDYYAPWQWVFASSAYMDEFIETTRRLALLAGLLGLLATALLCAVLYQLVRRMVVQPLLQTCEVAAKVAAGDLNQQLAHQRQDEIGQLIDAMNQTVGGLSSVLHTVQQRAESVSIASAEIARGNQDLAHRTESSASALEQTAAAMEQLGATVQHNAEHASSASTLARATQEVVTEGEATVRTLVHTMQGIHESSQKIADIIGVIDGIAFQTNILALNAAVEAARAGEHGRGFAVVAAEVRTLAQRSADAAKQIKTLIQNSVTQVEAGNERASAAGNAMERAMASIEKVVQFINDISHASLEQSNGVSQVGAAITDMDQHTQKNAALVEEMAGAAQSLRAQAQELMTAISVFQLASLEHAATPVTSSTARALPAPPGHAGREKADTLA